MSSPLPEFHPILSVEVYARTEGDRDRLRSDLAVLLQSVPAVSAEGINGRIIINGEDETALEAISKKIALEYKCNISEVRVNYRETIRKTAEAEGKYIRQTGGSGIYGHCKLRVEPREAGKGYEFINDIKGGVVPKEYIKPIDQGVQSTLELGILAGYPIVDVKVTLCDGSYHDVDSNDMAFKLAASIAFKEAVRMASPVLLEPVMAVEVTVPEEFVGTIIGDINSRRGRIDGIGRVGGSQSIKATVPMAELLRSSAHGKPRYTMHFAGYEAKPSNSRSEGGDAAATVSHPRSPKPGPGSARAKSG